MNLLFKDLKNKQVLITGTSSGIGKAQATAFLKSGAIVYGIDYIPSNIVHAHFQEQILDVKNETLLKQYIQSIAKNIDIVCNTVGILDDYLPLDEVSEEKLLEVFQINIKTALIIAKIILPYMKEKRFGVFVNMASIAGLIAGGGGMAYTMSKHALLGFSKQLNFDYATYNIRSNAIAPGAVKTSMTQSDFNNGGEIAQKVIEQTPANRYASPEEIANLTLYLASDVSKYILGSVIPIDGGWCMDKFI